MCSTKMNLCRISRSALSGLYLRQYSKSSMTLSSKTCVLLDLNSSLWSHGVKKCHLTQISRQLETVAPFICRNVNNLLLRDFACCNVSVSTSSVTVGQWRHLSNPASKHCNKTSSKMTEVHEKPGETDQVKVEPVKDGAGLEEKEGEAKKLSLYQRFKKTYKEHGKVLVVVHLLTSAVWFGSFYTVARCGFDIVPYLESWNFSEKIIAPFRSGGLGDVALAYLMYKLATPARYTVTIGGTNLAIRYLRREGKIPLVAQEDTIRSLYKESKENIKRRSHAQLTKLRRRHKHKQRTASSKDKTH